MSNKLRLKDKVIVLAGKDKGKVGDILSVNRKKNTALVSGVNLVKKHTKPTQGQEGGISQKEMSINMSNLSYFDEDLGKKIKLSYIYKEDKKIRVDRQTKKEIGTK